MNKLFVSLPANDVLDGALFAIDGALRLELYGQGITGRNIIIENGDTLEIALHGDRVNISVRGPS